MSATRFDFLNERARRAGDNGGTTTPPPPPPPNMEERLAKLEAFAEKASVQLSSASADLTAIKSDQATKKDLGDMRLDVTRLDGRVTESIAKLDGRLTESIAKLEGRLSENFAKLEGRLSGDLSKLEGRLSSDMHRLDATIVRWILTTVIGLFLGFAGLFFTMSNMLSTALKPAPAAAQQPQPPTVIVLPGAAAPATAQPAPPAASR